MALHCVLCMQMLIIVLRSWLSNGTPAPYIFICICTVSSFKFVFQCFIGMYILHCSLRDERRQYPLLVQIEICTSSCASAASLGCALIGGKCSLPPPLLCICTKFSLSLFFLGVLAELVHVSGPTHSYIRGLAYPPDLAIFKSTSSPQSTRACLSQHQGKSHQVD